MRNYFFSFLFISFNATAVDPFFGEQPQMKNEQNTLEVLPEIAKNSENLTACKTFEHKNSLNLLTEFEKLKLIGLVKINENSTALFIDEKEQLLDFKENQFIQNQEIEIKNINLKSLTYINWKLTKDCHFPYEITIKL
ncbi:hypothetical protein A6B40_09520 [Mannheimia varigena]|uniref:hypothetical protein n=1 Tax=Mannheimia varigena TaxID=85404 RepID=UPI00159D8506|nr:hypothetical protein [Mannheimia varigena]QLB17797.1 hypothetical protein A6B40_09520 [Mannheimia varigena]